MQSMRKPPALAPGLFTSGRITLQNRSSLYHHVPGGKADLFVEVMERIYARHRTGLTAALASAEPSVRAQLYAAAHWLLSQPPMDLVRLEHIDMAELAPAQVQRLSNGAYEALQLPLIEVLAAAHERGEIAEKDLDLVSGGFVGLIETLFAASEAVAGKTRRAMAERLIDVMLDGLRPRP